MKINKLYQYICKNLNGFKLLTSLEGRSFVLFELSQAGQFNFINKNGDQLKLISHHVSVYEDQDDRNAYLSQYHYTAYYEDQNGKFYQLHVYFNEDDQLTTKPVLSVRENVNSDYIRQDLPEEFIGLLKQIAIDNTSDMMRRLRKSKKETLIELENQYSTLERELSLLSINLSNDRGAYLPKLDEIILVLKELANLHENEEYQTILNLFESIKKTLVSIASNIPDSRTGNVVPEGKEEESITKTPNAVLAQSKKPGPVKKLLSELNAKVKMAYSILTSVPKEADRQRLNCFISFDKFVGDLLISMDDTQVSTSPAALQDALSHLAERNRLGSELLERLIATRNFELAKNLKKFVGHVSEKMFKQALESGDAELLDFILSSTKFPVNTFLLEGVPAVLYCYLHDNNGSKVDCLSVLIKYDASIMVKAPDGLSVAYHIAHNDHPLRRALDRNPERTIGRTSFYNQLMLEIDHRLMNGKNEPSFHDQLIRQKKIFQNEMVILPMFSKPREMRILKQSVQTDQQMELRNALLKDNFHRKLKENPEFQRRILELKGLLKDFLQILPPRRKDNLMSQIHREVDDINKFIKKSEDEVESKINVETTFQHMDAFKKVIELKIEAVTIENNLKESKLSKKEKMKLLSRYKQIQVEVSTLSKFTGFLGADKKPSSKPDVDTLIQGLETMMASTEKMTLFFQTWNEAKLELAEQLKKENSESQSSTSNNNNEMNLEDKIIAGLDLFITKSKEKLGTNHKREKEDRKNDPISSIKPTGPGG